MPKFNNFAKERLLFCNIAWMKYYRGTKGDEPIGGGSHPAHHKGEVENFLPKNGRCYGYVQPPGGAGESANIASLDRLGAAENADEARGVTVIWTARHPTHQGKVVVGWYKHATVRREYDEKLKRMDAALSDCALVAVEDRALKYPLEYRHIKYGDDVSDEFLRKLDKFMGGYARSNSPPMTPSVLRENQQRKYDAGGESERHKMLKKHVCQNPQIFGMPEESAGVEEFSLPSGDSLDVLFKDGGHWVAVEVKSRISDDGDIKRGIYQCVKYQAVLDAMAKADGMPQKSEVFLFLENKKTPAELNALARKLGVKIKHKQ